MPSRTRNTTPGATCANGRHRAAGAKPAKNHDDLVPARRNRALCERALALEPSEVVVGTAVLGGLDTKPGPGFPSWPAPKSVGITVDDHAQHRGARADGAS